MVFNDIVVLRGGGDIATGVAHRLYKCGFKVIILEVKEPTVVRRTVAFADAIFKGETTVEEVKSCLVKTVEEAQIKIENGYIPVIINPNANILEDLNCTILVDAILAKKNLGTNTNMAKIVIGLGPGFTAGVDVNAVIETNRGHNLGRVILTGTAEKNTGNPGEIEGYSTERIIRATANGKIKTFSNISDIVEKGQKLAVINETPVYSPLDGVLRGLIHNGLEVFEGMKIGDVDPRNNTNCYLISDKARAIAGGVLEAILYLRK